MELSTAFSSSPLNPSCRRGAFNQSPRKAGRIRESSFAKPCHLEGNFGIARVVCSLALKKKKKKCIQPRLHWGRGRGWSSDLAHRCRRAWVLRPGSAATSNRATPLAPDVPSPSPPKKHSPLRPLRPRREPLVFVAKIQSKCKGGEMRRFRAELPGSRQGWGGRGEPLQEGRKSELQGDADSDAEKIRFQREAASRAGAAGRAAGSRGRGWRGSRAGREQRAGGRGERPRRRELAERLARRGAESEGRAGWAASAPAPRCLEMDHLGEPASLRESGAVRRREGETERGRAPL